MGSDIIWSKAPSTRSTPFWATSRDTMTNKGRSGSAASPVSCNRLSLSCTIPASDEGLYICGSAPSAEGSQSVSYTHLRAHETRHDLVCRLLLEKKKKNTTNKTTRSL